VALSGNEVFLLEQSKLTLFIKLSLLLVTKLGDDFWEFSLQAAPLKALTS
jgi:hypothetical protein